MIRLHRGVLSGLPWFKEALYLMIQSVLRIYQVRKQGREKYTQHKKGRGVNTTHTYVHTDTSVCVQESSSRQKETREG